MRMVETTMIYDEPLFRPPSEAHSLIFQVTYGCSNNTCLFCGMYKMKKFRIRKFEDIKKDILECAALYPGTRKVFLADGDALVIKTSMMLDILALLKESFPALERFTSYANPLNLLNKPMAELQEVRSAGLEILYLGIESGSDKILSMVDKGVDREKMLRACKIAIDAGFTLSVTVLLGLGGKKHSVEHMTETASLCSEVNPHYLSALTLMLGPFEDYFKSAMGDGFEYLDKRELLNELKILVETMEADNCVFRTNHASNYLALKGTLSRDRQILLDTINNALNRPEDFLRPEFLRAL